MRGEGDVVEWEKGEFAGGVEIGEEVGERQRHMYERGRCQRGRREEKPTEMLQCVLGMTKGMKRYLTSSPYDTN